MSYLVYTKKKGVFCMAHLAKFKQSALGNMFNHYEHKKTRDNIDKSRSVLNYNLAKDLQPLKPMDFVHERLQNVKVQKRKDVNYLCDWCITIPKDVKPEDEKKFFQSCFDFMAKRYGKDCVVSAWVHKDEQSPHMHFAYLPIVINRKGDPPEKLSAKETNNRRDLQTFHTDLNKAITKALGYEVSLLTGETKEGNKTITQLKQQTELKKQQEYIDQTKKVLAECNKKTTKAIQELNGIVNQIDGYKALKNDIKEQIAILANNSDLYNRLLHDAIFNGDYQGAEELKNDIIDAQEAQKIIDWFRDDIDIPDDESTL